MSSGPKKMTRRQSKFIYEFLPYNTFNHAHCNISGRIMTLYHEQDDRGRDVDPGVPKNYLINRIHRRISKWPNAESIRDDLSYSVTELVVPNGAGYHLYPRTFECERCDSITTFTRDDDIEPTADENVDGADYTRCKNCGAKLSDRDQLPFVGICECGGINELYVPDCCDVGMELHRETTQMANWYFQCADSNCTEGSGGSRNTIPFFAVGTHCPRGECDNEEMDIINHTASRAFYPQVYNLINVRPELDDLHESDHYRGRIISDYLRGTDDTGPSDQQIRRKADEILQTESGAGLLSADEDEADGAMEDAREELGIDVQEHRRETNRWLHNQYDGDETDLAESVYEHLSITHPDYEPQGGIKATSYQEMVDNGATDTHLDLSVVKKYNDLRKSLNFDEMRLIKNFPITTVTYGYTRHAPEPPGEQRDPAEVDTEEAGRLGEEGVTDGEGASDDADEDGPDRPIQLNLFKRGDDAEPQLYVQTNDAEAVMVKLDKEAVLDWLEANEVITPDERPDMSDPEDVRRWFLTHIDEPSRYESLPDHGIQNSTEAISRHCYTLLNTSAHLFINAMGALAGHQRESLVERLLPHSMTFIIYKRPDTDFTLGSLWTLFEEQFDDFVNHLDELNDCSYDPVCMHDENGACEDCLYLAAISTENANHNLGRATFYGGPFDGFRSHDADAPRDDLTGYRDI
ncbi:hypothetical protein [Natrinema ejinorense]|uniref:DUF1998 domain-containing protein n=1 Tax=Natrinema ejinorense TaxID=373386 RepID=A0A2A5QSC9_9EURY|nr:hypothetical protein [Natrinema ejinorense]PCR89663.1 hypothetical protein CP557_03390 [Natrinema ejinorense]